MATSTVSWVDEYLDNVTVLNEGSYTNHPSSTRTSSVLIFFSKWLLRLTCIFIVFICPWANYKLIEFFQKRSYYKESSAKWYIIFKATFDTLYVLISVPIMFCLTFNIDIIHKNVFTCKFITYIHYLSDDIISIMLTLLCMDRMVRITCGYRLRTRFSLTICLITLIIFLIANIHHILRLQHRDGFCHKIYLSIWDYDFDIYYSVIFTSITWAIIFIASINLTVSLYCDRIRGKKLKKINQQEQNSSQIYLNGHKSLGNNSDRVELIHDTDEWDDPTAITIEQNLSMNKSDEQEEKQDNIDLELTVSVLITSFIFLLCNLPNFIIFIMRFVYHSSFSTIGYIFVYMSLFPLLFAHTISYFIFNHLAARIFPQNLT